MRGVVYVWWSSASRAWRWTAKARNGLKVANGGQGYTRRNDATGVARRVAEGLGYTLVRLPRGAGVPR